MKSVRFWLLSVAAVTGLVYGFGDVGTAVWKWDSPAPTCVTSPSGKHVCSGVKVLFMSSDWSPSAWMFLAIGLGILAVGACLLRLAWRRRQRPVARHALG